MKPFFLLMTFAGLALFSQACSPTTTISGKPDSPYHERLYSNLREARFHTIDKVLYQTKAAYFDEELARRYVDEYADRYRLPERDRQKLLAEQLSDVAENHVFYIAHFSTIKEASKLGKASSAWRLTLEPGGSSEDVNGGIEPTSMKTLESDDPYVQYFFPFVTPWSTNYRVMFPKTFDDSLTMRISGVLDQVSFHWDQK